MTELEEAQAGRTQSRRRRTLPVRGLLAVAGLAAGSAILSFPLGLVSADSTTAPAAPVAGPSTLPASAPSTTSSGSTPSTSTTSPSANSAAHPLAGAAPAVTPAASSPAPGTAQTAEAAIPPAASASVSPGQLGAEALALVKYPWQKIPGYSIVFEPISDAPAPGYYGNTTFTWGSPGGVSTMYVYPGETVQRLAGITAFEIGHEVDAAGLEPDGGHAAIEDALGIHPGSWSPDCDCAEQNYLSGWYAAAFSNFWSPGVGNWSVLAPTTGSTVAPLLSWLNPAIV